MKLLFVNCCISQRGEASRTLALAKAYLEAHPEVMEELDRKVREHYNLTGEKQEDADKNAEAGSDLKLKPAKTDKNEE